VGVNPSKAGVAAGQQARAKTKDGRGCKAPPRSDPEAVGSDKAREAWASFHAPLMNLRQALALGGGAPSPGLEGAGSWLIVPAKTSSPLTCQRGRLLAW